MLCASRFLASFAEGSLSFVEELLAAVLNDEACQRHQGDGEHELQAVDADEEFAGHELRDAAVDAHDERRHRDDEHEDHRHVEHPALAIRHLEEDGEGDQDECGEQLVGCAEQRPDIHVAGEAEAVGEDEREDCGDVFVHEELLRAARLDAIARLDHLLHGHAADAGDGVDRRHAECRYAHRDEAGREASRQAEDVREERADAGSKDLERRALCHDTVRCSSAGNGEGDDAEHALTEHRAVAYWQHIRLVGDGLRGRARGNEAVETGDSAAGDRDEEDWEQRLAIDFKTDKGRHIDGWVCGEDADDAAGDHAEQQERAQVIARLHEQPHRQDSCDEAVAENNVAPSRHIEVERELHADREHRDDEHDGDDELQDAGRLDLADEDAEAHGDDDVEHGDRSGLCARRVKRAVGAEAVERLRDDIGKRCDDEQREEPAEQQEQAAARAADVLLDEQAHRLAFILDRSVERREILDRAEERAADQDPEEGRQPAEHRGDDWAGHRACARDG